MCARGRLRPLAPAAPSGGPGPIVGFARAIAPTRPIHFRHFARFELTLGHVGGTGVCSSALARPRRRGHVHRPLRQSGQARDFAFLASNCWPLEVDVAGAATLRPDLLGLLTVKVLVFQSADLAYLIAPAGNIRPIDASPVSLAASARYSLIWVTSLVLKQNHPERRVESSGKLIAGHF